MNKAVLRFIRTLGRCVSGVSSIVIVFLCVANIVLAQDIDSLRNGIVKLVATVDGRQKTGTGFVVQHGTGSTLIVTAAHVVEGDKFPRAEFNGRRNDLLEAEVLRIEGGDRRGIALLKVRNAAHVPQNAAALTFSTSEHVQDGEDLMTIGFPSSGGSWDVLKINITSRDGRDLVLSGGLEEGNSGGPILKQGKVIGLVTGSDTRGEAVPTQIVTLILQNWGVAIPGIVTIEPAMVHIPSGTFLMGSPVTEAIRVNNEGPQREVTISPFAISSTEVTVGQFRQFVQDHNYHHGKAYLTTAEQSGKGCWGWNTEKKQPEQFPQHNWNNSGFDQNDDHPVVCVSWHDAKAYVNWLSHRTRLNYRLPTEAEWEYAARAKTTMARFFMDDKQCDYANGLGQEAQTIADPNWTLANCVDGYIYTAPVARFKPNPFGLFDMLGNVWEWTQDCWHGSYINAPKDHLAWLETNGTDCNHRVTRGGAWNDGLQVLRSARRSSIDPNEANNALGFRIARTL